jgi:hypothetical protein
MKTKKNEKWKNGNMAKKNKTSCEEFQTRGGTKLRFWTKLEA